MHPEHRRLGIGTALWPPRRSGSCDSVDGAGTRWRSSGTGPRTMRGVRRGKRPRRSGGGG
ncbi:hypothetical protein [Streptomyces sp. KM273126]|uniref:hypothetical protein n=1 Tax=Streptomyces sp. KM273126 TaxID=2545247 RepID=UPI0037DA782A